MTAISGAILEREAFRERLARQIASLRCIERTIEHADQVAGEVFGPFSTGQANGNGEVSTSPVPPGSGAGTPGAPPAEAPVRAPRTTPTLTPPAKQTTPVVGIQVLMYLQKQIAVSSRAEIAAAIKRPVAELKGPLTALVRGGRVIATGHTTARRFAIAKTSAPRPAEPIPPHQFETVWSGSKERKGEAPLLSDVRARKTS